MTRDAVQVRDSAWQRWVLAVAGVFLFALAMRSTFLWEIRDAPASTMLFVDSKGYDEWARRIAAGDLLGSGVFYQAPLYPYFLGVVYALFGPGITAVHTVQAVLGSVSCALLALAVARFADRRTGIVAGLILALSPAAIFSDTLVQKSVLDILLVCTFLLTLARALDGPSAARWLATGSVLALLMLTRENAAAFIPVLVACILAAGWRSPPRRNLAGAALGLAIVLVPVGIRNKVVGGEFLLTTSQFGTNLFIGNNPEAIGVYLPLRYGRADAPLHEQQDARELAESALGCRLTPAAVSDYWRGRALHFMRSSPGAWLRLMGRKLLLTLSAVEIPDAYDQHTYGDWSALLRWLNRLAHFGVLLPLAAAGIVLSLDRRRILWPLYALTIVYVASVALFYVFSRYRLPLVPLLAPFAAIGLTEVAAAARRRRWRSLAAPAAAAALAALVALAPLGPFMGKPQFRATMLINIGNRLVFGMERSEDAIPYLLEVIQLMPNSSLAFYNLGSAYVRAGRIEEGLTELRRAVDLSPTFAPAYLEISQVEWARGRAESAASWYERGLRVNPVGRETLASPSTDGNR